jgi:uncharacterized membrane protein
MDPFQVTLVVATLLCALVAGFLFAFGVVVMPGLRTLSASEYLRAFQVMDGVIQNNNPVFLLLWVGSVIALLAATGLGFGNLEGLERCLLLAAAGIYLLGVQLPTLTINVPLNNKLQALVVSELDAPAQAALRGEFESRWTRSNTVRTLLACLVAILLLVVLCRGSVGP